MLFPDQKQNKHLTSNMEVYRTRKYLSNTQVIFPFQDIEQRYPILIHVIIFIKFLNSYCNNSHTRHQLLSLPVSSGFSTSFPGAIVFLEAIDFSEGFVASDVSLAFDVKVATTKKMSNE